MRNIDLPNHRLYPLVPCQSMASIFCLACNRSLGPGEGLTCICLRVCAYLIAAWSCALASVRIDSLHRPLKIRNASLRSTALRAACSGVCCMGASTSPCRPVGPAPPPLPLPLKPPPLVVRLDSCCCWG